MLRILLTRKESYEIDKIRRAKKIKTTDILKGLDIKPNTWVRWKSGDASMPFAMFQKLEELIGTSFDNFGKRFESNYNGSSRKKTRLNI